MNKTPSDASGDESRGKTHGKQGVEHLLFVLLALLLWRAEILRALHRDEEARRAQEKGERKAMEINRNTDTDAERKLIRDVLEKK